MDLDLKDVPGLSSALSHSSLQILVRLAIAAVLGAAIGYRPWRVLLRRPRPPPETSQTQLLVAVAGAVMVIVIGDSLARAFGLVGLGAFVRFRSGIKDPRDAAVMFAAIGTGMAAGLGLFSLAGLATAFVALVLLILDLSAPPGPRRLRVGIEADHPDRVLAALKPVFPKTRVIRAMADGAEAAEVVIEAEVGADADAESILEALRSRGVQGIRAVSLVDE